MGLDHIALIVSSEKCLEFYMKLGFKETTRIIRDYDTVVFMSNSDVVLEIFIDSNHPERRNSPESKGIRHIAFKVDDLDEIMGKFECHKIGTDWFGKRFVFINDIDGQPIELKEK